MAIVVKDRVKETSITTGTGTFTLAGAATGYVSFATIGNGNTTYYTIYNPEDGSFEVGIGTYTSSGTTLSRDTVLANSLGTTAKIDFTAGTKDVFCTYPAEKAIYEEATGNVLIDGGPITVVGQGVTGYTTFSAALGELYADVDSFAQMYAQNYSDGSEASGDFVVYRDDALNDTSKFVDMGINSSNYSSATYPIFTPGSAYLFNDGAELFVGSGTDDLVLFAGGVDTTDEAARFDKTTKALTTVGDVNVGAALDVTGAATFGSTVLLNANPTLNLQAATKQYVDNAVSAGLTIHTPVRLERGSNLNATYNNGTAGVGATLTNAGAQAALVIDGITVSVNDRILVYGQTTATENGVYTVTTVGDGSTNWVLTRATDADTYGTNDPNKLDEGAYFYVTSGNTGAGESYVVTTVGTITFGTTPITFSQFSASPTYTGGTNIDITGQTISLTGTVGPTNGGTGVNTVTTGDLLYGSASNTWSKLAAGSAYKALVMNAGGTNVEWNAVALDQSGAVSGSLSATNGGTGQNAYTTGDMLYSDNTNSLAKLSGNTSTTKQFLTQTGTGSASQAPAWGTISGSDVTSAVSSATNVAGGAANQVVYQTGSGATGFVTAPVSAGTALTWNGSSFTWASGSGAAIADDTTTNTTYYPVWANATSGVLSTAYVSDGKLGFNPSTGTLSATTFSGAWSGIPSGTSMLFVQTSSPTGWTKSTTHDNKALRVVSGTASSGGTVAFTTAFASQTPSGTVSTSTTVNNTTAGGSVSTSVSAVSGSVSVSLSSGGSVSGTTLGTNEMPAHNHMGSHANLAGPPADAPRWGYGTTGNTTGYRLNLAPGSNTLPLTSTTGGSGSHTHGFTNPSYSGSFTFSSATASSSFTGTAHNHTASSSSSFTGSAIDLAVQYVDVIIATKD